MIIVGRNNTDNSVSKLVNNLNYLFKHNDIPLLFGEVKDYCDTIVCRGNQLKTSKTAWTYGFNDLVLTVYNSYYKALKLEVNKTYAPNILILGIPIKTRLDEYVKSNVEYTISPPLISLCMCEHTKAYGRFFPDLKNLDKEVFNREFKNYSKNFILINHIMEKYFKGTDEADSFSKAMEYIRYNPRFRITKSIIEDTDYWEKYENDLVNLLLKADYTFSFKVSRKEFKVDNFIPFFAVDTSKNKVYCKGFLRGVPIEDSIEKILSKESWLYPLSRDTKESSYTVQTVTGKYFTLGSLQ